MSEGQDVTAEPSRREGGRDVKLLLLCDVGVHKAVCHVCVSRRSVQVCGLSSVVEKV